jgi:hypothetical protein
MVSASAAGVDRADAAAPLNVGVRSFGYRFRVHVERRLWAEQRLT